MANIQILNKSYTEVVRERDPDEEWDADDTSTSNNVYGFKVAESNSKNQIVDIVVDYEIKPDKTYYLVSVIYSSGDSFSHHTGNIDYIMLYDNLEMAEATKKIIEDSYKRKDKEQSYSVEILNNNGELFIISSSCWVGYFETLEEVKIDCITLTQ
jgi:hypothetical protein